MALIKQLDQSTINKIAAGEVIERPCAIVKELVENAIDAKSNAITIEIKDGGISLIRITDNGSGIPKEDIPTAFLRHATSKIEAIEDLFTVTSLGFRGEALSSIAAIAQVELITKEPNELMGTRYVIEGGKEVSNDAVGCPEGTTFVIRNIFYNTPVRRKFLKTPVTEASHISDYVEKLALSHPDISFKFINNGQIKLNTSGNNKQRDIIYSVYGREITSNLIDVNNHSIDISITGFIGKAVICRGNRNLENYFINGRYIKSGIINKAIEEAYKPYMMLHKYPFTLLNISIDSGLIDVNVHPTKMEIRFMNSAQVYDFVYHTVKNALESISMIPEVELTSSKEKKKDERIKVSVPEPFEIKRRSNMGYRHSNFVKEEIKDTEIGILKDKVDNGLNYLQNKKNENEVVVRESSNISHNDSPASDDISKINGLEKDLSNTNVGDMASLGRENITKFDGFNVKRESNTKLDDGVNLSNERKITDTVECLKDEKVSNRLVDDTKSELEQQSKIEVKEQVNLFDKSNDSYIEKKKDIRIVGQVFLTYWIIELDGKMYIIDQHAAHEKVMYERLMKSLDDKETLSQMIAPQIIVTLNMKEEEFLKENMKVFSDLGFVIESFGGKDYSISALPANLPGNMNKEFFLDLLDNLMDGSVNKSEMLLEKVASMSCKAAVKGNSKLSLLEVEALIEELFTLDNPFNCPHGRPTTIAITKDEMEKKFKRQV